MRNIKTIKIAKDTTLKISIAESESENTVITIVQDNHVVVLSFEEATKLVEEMILVFNTSI